MKEFEFLGGHKIWIDETKVIAVAEDSLTDGMCLYFGNQSLFVRGSAEEVLIKIGWK